MGTVNPLGKTVEETWEKILAAQSGIRPLQKINSEPFSSKVAGQIFNLNSEHIFTNLKTAKRLGAFVEYAGWAVKEALIQSGISIHDGNALRIGINLGSGIGGLKNFQDETIKLMTPGGERKVSAFYITAFIGNIASGFLAIEHGLRGPNSCIQTACASSNHSIAHAFDLIRTGQADVMVSGGTEATITESSFAGFSKIHALSTHFNDTPEKASRPFDLNRDGFVMSEGAGALVLEELEHAKKRKAEILAEIIGSGLSSDAYHIVMPHPEGQGGADAMRQCLAAAGLNPDDVDYINAHGTSTPLGDEAETKAIKAVFNHHSRELNVSSTKSMLGHMIGAAGAVEAILCVKALMHQVVPPTINLEHPAPGLDLNYTPLQPQTRAVRVALSNAFGFGGHNSTLAFRKFEG
jgi:3-oxoacyl-[acyl-carrier-protein] synthase II